MRTIMNKSATSETTNLAAALTVTDLSTELPVVCAVTDPMVLAEEDESFPRSLLGSVHEMMVVVVWVEAESAVTSSSMCSVLQDTFGNLAVIAVRVAIMPAGEADVVT
jgi:hypothetical protein